MTVYSDIADRDEDERIDIIAHHAIQHPQVVGFVVETDEKADRYIRKLQEKYPAIQILSRGSLPDKGTVMVMVKVGPPVN